MWRQPKREEIKRGVTLFATASAYNGMVFAGHVILFVKNGEATLARPMAWASEHYDDSQVMLSCETYTVSVERLCSDMKDGSACWNVWVERHGGPHTMTT